MSEKLNEIRNKVIDALLLATAVLVVPASIGSFIRFLEIGWRWIFIFHFVLTIFIILIYLSRSRLSTSFKAHSLSISFVLISFTGTINFGVSSGYFLCIIATLITTVTFGRRTAIFYSIISFLGLSTIAFLHIKKIIQVDVDYNIYNNNITTWVSLLMVMIFSMTTIVIGIGFYYNLFLDNIIFLTNKSEELEKSEVRYRNLYESMIDAYALVDMDGRLIQFNESFSKMLGYESDELSTLTYKDLTPEIWHSFEQNIVLSQVIPNGYSNLYEKEYRKKDGRLFPVELRTYLMRDKSGNPIGMWAIIRDITIAKQIKMELEEHKENLEEIVKERTIALGKTIQQLQETQLQLIQTEKLASLGILTAGIAHEINNPINYINSSIVALESLTKELIDVIRSYETITPENVEKKIIEIEEFKKSIGLTDTIEGIMALSNNIKIGTNKTADIVRSLRTFSRTDNDNLETANINDNLDSTLILLHSQYKDRIEIVKHYDNLPPLNCFPGKLNQVLLNLLSNAIQSIEGSGTITIKTEYKLAGFKNFQNESILISFIDTGSGIPLEIQNKVFEPFFTTKETGKGTGLGLAISYGIIEQHKGKIEFTSEVGKGTEFNIYLPCL